MQIVASDIALSSTHTAVERQEVRERLRAWVGTAQPQQTPAPDRAQWSARAQQVLAGHARHAGKPHPTACTGPSMPSEDLGDPRLLVLKLIIEKLTGRRIHTVSPAEPAATEEPAVSPTKAAEAAPQAPVSVGWGIEYDRHVEQVEAEQTTFSAEGVIRTADGQELRFQVELDMSREFRQQEDISIRLGDAARKAQDPLVINFGGTAAQLTGPQVAFDLNADGTEEQMTFVGPQSALLALDANGDGQVNDGTELFGPQTGDGFAELAAQDADGNGWIDGADPVYARLSLWSKDAEGNDVLQTLDAGGVGAIYLGRVATPFDLKDAQNDTLGVVQSTGLYAGTDGTVGTVQQLDVVV